MPKFTDEEVDRLLAEAKVRIAEMDETDEFPVSVSVQLGNVAAALHAGMCAQRWDCVADAMVMLSQCNDSKKVALRPAPFNSYVK